MKARNQCRVGAVSLFAMLLCGTTPALAQSVTPPPTPSEKSRPDFDPVGGRIGSFMLYPQIDATIEYDDNVLADDTGKRGDLVASLRPAARVVSLWQRHRLEATAYLEQSLYSKLDSENRLEGGIRVAGHLDIDRDSRLDASASFDALAEDRSQISATRGTAKPVRYTRAAANLGYTRTVGDLSLGAQVYAARLSFEDSRAVDGTPIDQDFRNSTYLSGTTRATYRIGPGISLLARAQLDRLDYARDTITPDPLDRDSKGMKLEAGVYLELSRLLFGEVRAGYLKRWNSDGRIPDASGLSFGASLVWFPTPLTSLKLTADREVEDGGSINTAGNLRSRAGLVVEHELLRSLVVAAEARVAKIEPIGPLPNAWEYSGQLRATYYLNRNLRLIGRVEHFRRNTDAPLRGLSRNRIMLTARLVF